MLHRSSAKPSCQILFNSEIVEQLAEGRGVWEKWQESTAACLEDAQRPTIYPSPPLPSLPYARAHSDRMTHSTVRVLEAWSRISSSVRRAYIEGATCGHPRHPSRSVHRPGESSSWSSRAQWRLIVLIPAPSANLFHLNAHLHALSLIVTVKFGLSACARLRQCINKYEIYIFSSFVSQI